MPGPLQFFLLKNQDIKFFVTAQVPPCTTTHDNLWQTIRNCKEAPNFMISLINQLGHGASPQQYLLHSNYEDDFAEE